MDLIETAAETTTIGGYGQFQAQWVGDGPDPEYVGTATVRRLVLFVSHDFSHMGLPIAAYTELEWENAIAGDGQPGSVEVEQAYIETQNNDFFQIRAGLILVPMGIINQWHEPPVFHGVDRPSFDQLIIPSTWRELGVGFSGRAGVTHYEAYAMTALDPIHFDSAGIVNGRTLGAEAPANAIAFTGRFEVEPRLGIVIGTSGYASNVGTAHDWYSATGEKLKLSIPVLGTSLDMRARRYGFEFKAVGALWSMPESDDLMEAYKADGSPYFPIGSSVVPTKMIGGYTELAFNVLSFWDTRHEVLPFARLEHYNTQWGVPDTLDADPLRMINEGTFGLTWRPGPGLAIKADVQLRDRKFGDDTLQWNLGFGYMF